MRRVYICPTCEGIEQTWDYPLQGTVCSSCGTPSSKWKIHNETYSDVVLPKEPEIRREQVVREITRQMEEQTLEEVYDEISSELKPEESEITPEIGQESKPKIPDDLLPADFDELISLKLLRLDPYNPRDEEPTDDLVESIRKTGFARAVIVRPSDDGNFFVTDGWQRAQAGVISGWKWIPCKIYASAPEALDETRREDIKRKWTKYQRIKFYRNFYEANREAGMDHQSAIQRMIKKDPASEPRILMYLRITNTRLVPPLVQALVKKPKNRTDWEWNQLEKIYYPIKRKRKALTIAQANAIAIHLRNFTPEQKVRAAIGVLGLTNPDALHKIWAISKYPEADPLETIQKLEKGVGIDEILDVGIIVVNLKLKRELLEYCAMRRIRVKDLVRELLTEWWIREKIGGSIKLDIIELKT